MNIDLSTEADLYGRTARDALEAAGGDKLVAEAEGEPGRRAALVVPVLAELGAWDLDPRGSADELEAAAAVCRAAGWWAAPYPVAARLCRPVEEGVEGQFVVSEVGPAAPLAGLAGTWGAVTLDGQRRQVRARPAQHPRRSAFVTALDLAPVGPDGRLSGDAGIDASGGLADAADAAGAAGGLADAALGLVLGAWTLLGMLDRAAALTRAHVLERQQFGQPLARFQGVQFQLTEAEVERAGVVELAGYALWSVQTHRAEAFDDALALRLAAVEAAETVFRICHQLHGAMGFCDETTLSWISRHSQPLRRLPLGRSGVTDALTRRIGRGGLHGLFDEEDAG